MNNKIFTAIAALSMLMASCSKDLNRQPSNQITAADVYSTPLGYTQAMAKVYAAFANTGNVGGTGSPDLPTQIIADEGNSDFLRLYFNLQELTTDEAAWSWESDAGIQGLHEMSWSSNNAIIDGLYYRSIFQITLCNDFIAHATDAQLAGKGFPSTTVDSIRTYRAEARFLRAYQYWVLMDLFGNPPFATENDPIGNFIPKQISRSDLFNYVESELIGAADSGLVAPHQNQFGRADQGAAWALLARLYLNAQVYTGTARYTDAITYCNKLINAGYSLHKDYTKLMLADNNKNTDENIFDIVYNGTFIQNYGGTTYLMHGPTAIPDSVSGCNGSWSGLRFTQDFMSKFPDYSGATDHRAQFWTNGQTLDMTSMYTSTAGFSTFKYRDKTSTGQPDPYQDVAGNYSSICFPLFRFGEVYLNYAEAVLRGGSGGDPNTALAYINSLRGRAYGDSNNYTITASQLTLPFILDERARELYYECFRRTDLIRFNEFTTSAYLWAWKGGVIGGTAVSNNYNLFPIPTTDLSANPNLKTKFRVLTYKCLDMKKIFALAALLTGLLSGCNKNLPEPMLHSPSGVSGFAVSSSSIMLSTANDSATVAVFSWQNASYGLSVPVTYTLQIDQPSDTSGANAWGNAINSTITGDSLTKSWLGTDFNHLLNQMGLAAGTASTIVARLKMDVTQSNGSASSVPTLFSTLAITVTPYKVAPIYPKLYVAGDWTAPTWTPVSQPGFILASVLSNGVYEGYVNFPNAGNNFKMCSEPDWNGTNYGWGTSGSTISGSSTAGNCWSAGPAYARVTADVNQLTITYTNTSWNVAGDFNSWTLGANAMTFNPATNTWTATGVQMTAGNQWKFVGDTGWNNCYGEDSKGNFVFGNGSVGNFTVTKTGTYTVTLDLSQGAGNYTYSVK